MTAADLRRRLRRHNLIQVGSGIVLILGAIVLWPLSYWVFRVLFYIPLAAVGLRNADAISLYLTWAGMALLVVEGCRNTRPLFDLKDFSQSVYYQNPVAGSASGRAASRAMFGVGNPMAFSYLVSQFLFCAPQTSVLAVKALRSVIRAAPGAFEQAAQAYTVLAEQRRWIPASQFRHWMAGVMLLDRLGLIWTEVKAGEMQLRIPPGSG
jgi:hypothetical protein